MNTSTSTRKKIGTDPIFLADWEKACREDAELAGLGSRASVRFGVEDAVLEFVDGKLAAIRIGAGKADFALRAPASVWDKFLQPVPPAPYHHVLAMKMRVPEFSVAGDEEKLLQYAHLVRRSLELARWVANDRSPAALRPEAPAVSASGKEPIAGGYAAIDIEGRRHRLYFEQAGSGRDLLFLHTAGSDTRQFRSLMNDAALAREWRMTAFDLPWHGKSSPPAGWRSKRSGSTAPWRPCTRSASTAQGWGWCWPRCW